MIEKRSTLRWWDPRRWIAAAKDARAERRRLGIRTPMPALLVILFSSAIVAPLFWVGAGEDEALSATTSARQYAGGDDVSRRVSPNNYDDMCRDSPVEFLVDGQRVTGRAYLAGKCLSGDENRVVTLRYNPDDPTDFTELEPQRYYLYGLAALAALGFLGTLVAVLRRAWAHVRPTRM